MTNTQKIKVLEERCDLLHSFCRELELKLAALDSEHADTRCRLLLLVPEETQGSIVEIEADPPRGSVGRDTQGNIPELDSMIWQKK